MRHNNINGYKLLCRNLIEAIIYFVTWDLYNLRMHFHKYRGRATFLIAIIFSLRTADVARQALS